jgi:hypothetical protein
MCVQSWRSLANYRQSGTYPETDLGEINGDVLEADLWIVSILAHLASFFQRGEPIGMYDG